MSWKSEHGEVEDLNSFEIGFKSALSNEWINVNDRLPEKDGRYLVTTVWLWPWVEICSLREGKWDSGNHVKYWMTLPELPEEIKK